MNSQRIVAFYSPYPGAGKTTATEYLQNSFGYEEISFADQLKHIVSQTFGLLGVHDAEENKDEPIPSLDGATFRDFLIAFGNAGRAVYPNIRVDIIRALVGTKSMFSWAIDDLRFPNEYTMLREEGAKIIRITVPGRAIVPSASEALLEGYEFDAEIENTMNDIEAYQREVQAVVEGLWTGGI